MSRQIVFINAIERVDDRYNINRNIYILLVLFVIRGKCHRGNTGPIEVVIEWYMGFSMFCRYLKCIDLSPPSGRVASQVH